MKLYAREMLTRIVGTHDAVAQHQPPYVANGYARAYQQALVKIEEAEFWMRRAVDCEQEKEETGS